MQLKQTIIKVLWVAFLLAMLSVFFVALNKKQLGFCAGIEIEITNATDQNFISKTSIENIINTTYNLQNTSIKKIDIQSIETIIEKNPWVLSANLFFDANRKLRVLIEQKKPIARIFSVDGTSFFLDSVGKRLPITSSTIARVLVVTGFPSSNINLSKSDSILLFKVKNVCNAIANDSVLQAQIAQLHVLVTGSFELSTTLGNQKVIFGDDEDLYKKLVKIKTFYKQIFATFGEEKYSQIDVRFGNQIVATNKNFVFNNLLGDSVARIKDTTSNFNYLFQDSVAINR